MEKNKTEKETSNEAVNNYELRKRLLKKYKKCVYCGCNNPLFLEKEHVIPKSRGGPTTENNLEIACILCNRLKGNLTKKEYRTYLKGLNALKDLAKVSLIVNMEVKVNLSHYPSFHLERLKSFDDEQKKIKEKKNERNV